MNPTLMHLAGAVARPRTRRPACLGSGWGVALGCGDGQGRCRCPRCETVVETKPLDAHSMTLAQHREVGR